MTSVMQPVDVFISYKREDQAFVETLRAQLLEWGYTVWMDVYNIPSGGDWPVEIENGLKACHTVIAVMTPLAVQSRNVLNEWEWAIVREKRLLPVQLEPCELPLNLIRLNYIDFTQDHTIGFARIKAALAAPDPVTAPADPDLPYLQALYERINAMLAHAIVKIAEGEPTPIELISERTRGAVDELFERRDQIDPFFVAMGMEAAEWQVGDFHSAFEHFDGRVLLLGEPGAGKTITLLHFGRDVVLRRITDPTAPIPILALIPTWNARDEQPLVEWIADGFGAPSHASEIIEQGRALLLLDGLDELGGEREDPITQKTFDPRRRFLRQLADLPTNQMIVTCRIKDYTDIDLKIAVNGAVTLQELSDPQIRDYLEDLPDLWSALEADAQLREMARTPLLLSFFAFAYRDQGDEAARLRNLSGSPGDLRDAIFARYVRERYTHEQRKLRLRGESMQFTLDEIYAVLGRVALLVDYSNREPTTQDFANVIESADDEVRMAFETCAENCTSAFLGLAVGLNLLVIRDKESYAFIHLLLRDHFLFPVAMARANEGTDYERERAMYALGQMGDVRALDPLMTALEDPNWKMQEYALRALRNIGKPAADRLIHALDSDNANVRENILRILGGIDDERALDGLIKMAQAQDATTRFRAVEALCKYEDSRVVPVLIKSLDDPVWGIRFHAARALGPLADSRAVEPLIARLNDPDERVLEYVQKSLGQFKDEQAVDAFIRHLDSENTLVVKNVLRILGGIGDVRAVDPVLAMLSSDDASLRVAAVKALGRLGDTRAVDPLLTLLDTDDEALLESAVRSLGRIGDERAVEPLLALVSHEQLELSGAVIYSLAELADARALDTFMAALADDDMLIRGAAIGGLKKLGDVAVEPLSAALQTENVEMRRTIVAALDDFEHPAAIGWLIDALQDVDKWVRWYAVSGLEDKHDERAIDPLIAVLHDADNSVRVGAVQTLNSMLAVDERRIVQALASLCDDPVPSIRSAIVQALATSEDPLALDCLIATLQDADAAVRQLALDTLRPKGDEQLVDPLMALLDHANPDVQISALNALQALSVVDDAQLVRALATAFDGAPETVRREIVLALGASADPQAMDLLTAALEDDDAEVRRQAVTALRGKPSDALVNLFVRMLDDTDAVVRMRLINALKDMPGLDVERVFAPFVALLSDDSLAVRAVAAKALATLGDERAVEHLIGCLVDVEGEEPESTTDDTEIPAWLQEMTVTNYYNDIMEALTQIGTPEALAAVEAWRAAHGEDEGEAEDQEDQPE